MMNCLLTLPLPTVQPSFNTITYGLIVVPLDVVAHNHGRPGITLSDLHGKCKPSSFPQSYCLPPPSPMHCLIVVC